MTAFRTRRHRPVIRAVTLAAVFASVAAAPIGQHVASAAAPPHNGDFRPTIDVPAPDTFATQDVARRGGIAVHIEFAGGHANSLSPSLYRLNYVDGGSRLQVFEHYATTTSPADKAMMDAQVTGWKIANEIVDGTAPALPQWAHVRTGRDTGYSAGLMIALAYLDALTPGRLVGRLRVAGTGGIGSDGVVMPVNGVDAKVAAAMLTHPDIVFTTSPPRGVRDVTVIESDHVRLSTSGSAVATQLNLTGYQNAGHAAASSQPHVHFVVVHDIRQALAYLCGFTELATTCDLAAHAAALPIGTPAG